MDSQAESDHNLRWDLVPGTRFMTFYAPSPFLVAYAEAPPPYASEDLATSWCGAQLAGVGAHCEFCEAIAVPDALVGVGEGETEVVRRRVPHDPGCLLSAETIGRLDDACRPADYAGPGPVTEDEIERLAEALAGLHKFHEAMPPEMK